MAKDFSNSSYYTIGEQVLSGYNKQIAMKSAKLTQEQVNLLNQNFSMEKISLDENAQTAEESMGNLAIAYIAIILIFLFSYLYSVYAGERNHGRENIKSHGNYYYFHFAESNNFTEKLCITAYTP